MTQGAEWGMHFRRATMDVGGLRERATAAVWASHDGGVGQGGG